MQIDQVKKLQPIDRLAYWIKERESIRLKKEAGKPKPWTDDTILQSYRFCNVRRMDDKVSKWLMDNWYKPYKNHHNIVAAVAVARFFNLPNTLQELTKHLFVQGSPKWDLIKESARKVKRTGVAIFNGAYMVRGNDGSDKVECVIDHYVRPMLDKVKIDPTSMKQSWSSLVECYGYGSFMAGQIVADLRWAMDGGWKDKMTWAPVGPGSARGIAWTLFPDSRETSTKKFVNDSELFTTTLIELIPRLKKQLPTSITNRLEAHDFQNCMCEFYKYNRVLFGLGRPKSIYKGVV